MTKLAATLPGGDANGLVAIARALIDSPHEIHVAVVLVDCKKTTTDNDSGEVVPTARVRRIEVLGEQDKLLAQKMLAPGAGATHREDGAPVRPGGGPAGRVRRG